MARNRYEELKRKKLEIIATKILKKDEKQQKLLNFLKNKSK